MKVCALAPVQDLYESCAGRVTWHHVWTYAGRQIDEAWAIVPACEKAAFEAASLMLVTEEDLAKYGRKPWRQIKKALGLFSRSRLCK